MCANFRSQKNYAERERIYKMDPLEKPPFNYAQIIAMAMMDRGRMTLKDICKWIQEHFAYFRYNKNWNVSNHTWTLIHGTIQNLMTLNFKIYVEFWLNAKYFTDLNAKLFSF